MMKKMIVVKIMAAFLLVGCVTGCESTGSAFNSWFQSPEVKQEIAQLEQWAEQQAIAYVNGQVGNLHLFGVKKGAKYSAAYVQQQAVVTAQAKFPNLSRATIQQKVSAAFAKQSAR